MNQLPKFSKKGLFWNFTVTYKTVLTTPLEKKDESLKFVCSKSANEKNRLENFFHRMSSWTGIMHIWQLRRKFFHQRPTNFCSFTEKKRKFSIFKKSSLCLKRIQWTRRMQFRQFRRKKSTKIREVFAHWPKLMEKPIFWTTFLSIFPTNTEYGALTTQPETNNQNAKFFLAHCLKMIKETYNFFKEMIFFLKMLLRTPRMQFWQNSPKNFNQKLEMFAHCAKMIK